MMGRHSTYLALREWLDWRFQEPQMEESTVKKSMHLFEARSKWKEQRSEIEKHPLVLTGGEEGKLQIVIRATTRDALRATILAEIDDYIEAIEKELTELGMEF